MSELQSRNPGRDAQRVGTAQFLGQDPRKIHDPVWGVAGTLGESQCYLGVTQKVNAIHDALADRIIRDDLPIRLIPPAFTIGVSDGQLNGTPEMRFSLIGREITNDGMDVHLNANLIKGFIAVIACDKPPPGTVAAVLAHNEPTVLMSDGAIHPGVDPVTGDPLDIITGFQAALDPDDAVRNRLAMHACPGQGSCAGMFTYNTMQTFIATIGMEPLIFVSPASDDPRRVKEFPDVAIDHLLTLTAKGIRPRDIVTPAAIRNGLAVATAMGGSTNVLLHGAEIARAAGYDLWQDVITQDEFNELSHKLPVLVDARPFGKYSMIDVDERGGVAVIVKELLDAGFIDGSCMTCTGETLADQVARLDPPAPDGTVIYPLSKPYKGAGGLRILKGNLAPDGGAVIKVAGVEGGVVDGKFVGRARTFESEAALIDALDNNSEIFQDRDIVVIRYEGPRGAPGMPEMLDPTSKITALCRIRNITIAMMTDARFSGGSVGFVIGHVSPEAYLGGPIALVKDGDEIVVDIDNHRLDCTELADPTTFDARMKEWQAATDANGGLHPSVRPVTNRVLKRMRATARPPLKGAGMATPGQDD